MATVKQYINNMRTVQIKIANQYGCDISREPLPIRVVSVSILAIIAVVLRTLTVQGVITDAQLQAQLAAAEADIYEPEPVEPPPPSGVGGA